MYSKGGNLKCKHFKQYLILKFLDYIYIHCTFIRVDLISLSSQLINYCMYTHSATDQRKWTVCKATCKLMYRIGKFPNNKGKACTLAEPLQAISFVNNSIEVPVLCTMLSALVNFTVVLKSLCCFRPCVVKSLGFCDLCNAC